MIAKVFNTKAALLPVLMLMALALVAAFGLWMLDNYYTSSMMRSPVSMKVMPFTLLVCTFSIPGSYWLFRNEKFLGTKSYLKALAIVLSVLLISYTVGLVYFNFMVKFPFEAKAIHQLILQNLFVISLPFWIAILGLLLLTQKHKFSAQPSPTIAEPRAKPVQSLSATFGSKTFMLESSDIIWAKADGNYIKLYTKDKFYLKRTSLSDLLTSLPSGFVRIHKSFAVNTAFVESLASLDHGDLSVELKNGESLKCSRHFAKSLKFNLGL